MPVPRSASNAIEFEGFYVQCSTLLKEKHGAGGLSLISARLGRRKKNIFPRPHSTDQVVLSRNRVTDIPGGIFMGARGNLRYLLIGPFCPPPHSIFE